MDDNTKPKSVVFVSGHLDLTVEEFGEHYDPELHKLVQHGCTFVVGDARGCDAMTQEWFSESFPLGGAPVHVYHMLEKPRNLNVHAETVGGYGSDELRDAAMTRASTEDLAWIRPGKNMSRNGTAKNLARRAEFQAEERREVRRAMPRFCVGVTEIYPHYYLVSPSGDPYNTPLSRDEIPVPADLKDRMRAAWAEYLKCQTELERYMREQENDPV